jgi:hypothetical protein
LDGFVSLRCSAGPLELLLAAGRDMCCDVSCGGQAGQALKKRARSARAMRRGSVFWPSSGLFCAPSLLHSRPWLTASLRPALRVPTVLVRNPLLH